MVYHDSYDVTKAGAEIMQKRVSFSLVMLHMSDWLDFFYPFLGGSDTIKLLFSTILKHIEEHATEKLNTELFYHRKLNHIPLHITD